jgi:hypothetical protein
MRIPQKKAPPKAAPVSFRLDPATRKRLEEQAAAAGLSPGELARELVIDALTNADLEQLRQEIALLRADLAGQRKDLTTAVEAILVTCADVRHGITKEKAQDWTQHNLGRPAA